MFIPSQGFRHAARLLLANSVRGIGPDTPPASVADALTNLAEQLVSLSRDMRAAAETREWLLAEYVRAIEALPQEFDVGAAAQIAARILERVGTGVPAIEPRDLFLTYVPEDRLPIAAPLAIELIKRRVTVAFSDYEVSTPEQAATAIDHGLAHHRHGVVLATSAFERADLRVSVAEGARIRVLRDPQALSTLQQLLDWVKRP